MPSLVANRIQRLARDIDDALEGVHTFCGDSENMFDHRRQDMCRDSVPQANDR